MEHPAIVANLLNRKYLQFVTLELERSSAPQPGEIF
ncbi:hypothetical protein DSM3645_29262 [Blastopirellula marina DSM 3645]|uniref:Uncharacterized protein n=1 Tax=Blastopirellula marina DSM 3645 TaxID=314230 RepID=A3ZPS2_9BACT|nr:hypothetical protein DSM3645_29262 [Blastopirellula marina DSM 3645]